jgi:hypothetical protein
MKELANNVNKLCNLVKAQDQKIKLYEKAEHLRAVKAAESVIQNAVNAGRLAPKDKDSHSFWKDSLLNNFVAASAALMKLPVNAALDKVTEATFGRKTILNRLGAQNIAIAKAKQNMPSAKFDAIYAKAKQENPKLFS